MFDVKDLFYKSELIPVIVQDIHTKQVLMLGFANQEAAEKTLETRTAWFWSRSRKRGCEVRERCSLPFFTAPCFRYYFLAAWAASNFSSMRRGD